LKIENGELKMGNEGRVILLSEVLFFPSFFLKKIKQEVE
jgi:hypothetical protein